MSAGAYSTRELHGDQSSSIAVPMCSLSAKCTPTKSPKYANFQRKWKELAPVGLAVDKCLAGWAGGEELVLWNGFYHLMPEMVTSYLRNSNAIC